jgi:hypothetical protein
MLACFGHPYRTGLTLFAALICTIAVALYASHRDTHSLSPVSNSSGAKLLIADENADPTLRLVLPGHPDTDRTIEVIFPEHVTAKAQGLNEVEHLYLFRPDGWANVQPGAKLATRPKGRSSFSGARRVAGGWCSVSLRVRQPVRAIL